MRAEATVDYTRFAKRKPAYCSAAVLVVDDEAIALTVVSQLLKRIGFTDIDSATNGLAARTMMTQKKYGLVISDWNMPEMNGLDLLKATRGDESLRKTPFVITSIDGSLERVQIARVSGVSAFLLKPFDETTLRTKLEEVFQQAARLDRPAPEKVRRTPQPDLDDDLD
ncbi:MAG TPA: response regulator [Beijerinckiaceae bacterium]|jgi:two-component system chemotaxis response regulator CheY